MFKAKNLLLWAILILFTFTLLGCSTDTSGSIKEPEENSPENNGEEIVQEEPIDLKEIKANEVGQIMVLEWHVIGEKEGRWARTYENFRKDLETLYERGYRLVSLRDVLNNNISTEAGFTPVILTFDDGTSGHFRYIGKDGEMIIDPTCAVGILKEMNELYPDFGLEATFFVNKYPIPFEQRAYWQDKVKEVIELGMDIGNHTVNHPKLNKLSQEEVAKELALMVEMIEEVVPGYKMDTLALPFGIKPQDINWAVQGEYQGIDYHNIGVLDVGSTPMKSPVAKGYDPTLLPRVQVFGEGAEDNLLKWLDYFDKNPHLRYISDGDPDTIAVPKDQEEKVDTSRIGEKELIIYE